MGELGVLYVPLAIHFIPLDQSLGLGVVEKRQDRIKGDMVQERGHQGLEPPGASGDTALHIQVGDAPGEEEAMAVIGEVCQRFVQTDLPFQHPPFSHEERFRFRSLA